MLRREFSHLIDPTGRANQPERTRAVAALFDLRLADEDDIRVVREISSQRIGDAVASVETFSAVQRRTQSSVFVFGEKGAVSAMVGLFFLREPALALLDCCAFDASKPDLELIAPPGEPGAAAYGWGFVATSPAGGHAVVRAAMAFRDTLSWAIPTFTRTATEDGVRIIRGPMRYQIYRPGEDQTLVWLPPSAAHGGRGL
ncbi:MAG: hypothetical protein ABUS57_01540 [Pseudomonadota bacterium]